MGGVSLLLRVASRYLAHVQQKSCLNWEVISHEVVTFLFNNMLIQEI